MLELRAPLAYIVGAIVVYLVGSWIVAAMARFACWLHPELREDRNR
jgi:hypothetical protein